MSNDSPMISHRDRVAMPGEESVLPGGDSAITQQTNDLAKKSFELSLDQAARGGNEQLRQELIALRTKAALAGSEGRKGDLKQILGDLPQLIENQRKLNENKKQNVESIITDLELSWSALLALTLSEFDYRIESLRASANEFTQVANNPLPKIAVERDRRTTVILREIRAKNDKATIQVRFTQGAVSPGQMQLIEILFEVSSSAGVDDDPFRMYLDFNSVGMVPGPEKKPQDGLPTEAMKTKVKAGIGKTIERFLILQSL